MTNREQVHANNTIGFAGRGFSALRRSPQEFARELRLALAIHWYSRGEISQERAAQVAGMNRIDFLLALASEQVDAFVVESDQLRQELARG